MNLITIALATAATTGRVLLLILLSIVTGWFLGYLAVKNRSFENTFVPLIDILESIPVLGFLPVVLVIFITGIGGPLGVEIAADFLVFDAIVWNIWIGIYQAYKTMRVDLIEVTDNYNLGFLKRMRYLYIPYSIPRIAANLFPSFADAFFYITVSEVFAVGVHTYQTFGIGTLIANFIASENLVAVYYSLAFLAVAVVGVTLIFREFAGWSVARYGLDTPAPIRRRGRFVNRPTYLVRQVISTPMKRISRYASRIAPRAQPRRQETVEPSRTPRAIRYIVIAVIIMILLTLAYYSFKVAVSVTPATYLHYISLTPYILYSMAVDYLRVALITLLSLAIAVFLGYYLATHHRVGTSTIPLIQTISAFPAPAYFPLIFAATVVFLNVHIPFITTELYVFTLGFLSTFYYVFFGFIVGVQSIPTEFWEIMENHGLGFFTKMRRVILPATFPYLITGLSSTINSAWGGLMVGEYWPNIYGHYSLIVGTGMMKLLDVSIASGQIGFAAWISIIFAVVVAVYGIYFTRKMMDLANKKYVIEEGLYAA
ncbi:MAG: ABC transporter permease subunit [Nitrososphaerota archaeon]|jgi:NitT/TauT family transport system permease protein|nr:ABC transporter permease subunit [Nitrososphaerota archaeon]MDG7040599.1 ABC transporter permease subunit [Nitrososphaerota archaeon]MDG7042529.1 ABC transporter permease subunit [Nitrososphaerota archaeon]